ncbi:MAG: SufD family Fe-S cluster assembly protein [Desulfuromonadaceae bacterium]
MNQPDALRHVFQRCGGDSNILQNPAVAHLLIDGHEVVGSRALGGMEMASRPVAGGIRVSLRILRGYRFAEPMHLCFGLPRRQGRQKIIMDVHLEAFSELRVFAHCLFPEALDIQHRMQARVILEEQAELHYYERHVHGPQGGVLVVPKARVQVGPGGKYYGDFALTSGRVGQLDIDYTVEAERDAVVELTNRLFGHGDDSIRIRENILLNGENARGLIKARIALEDRAQAEVRGITEGRAAGARGHVDCLELVKDAARASAVPKVKVSHPLAKVTHEAAIGSVDQRQMETLMAHGLSPEEAVDIIVTGILQ